MSGPPRILLIIADDMLRQIVAEHLRGGATVAEAAEAEAGLIAAHDQDLIVVDEALAQSAPAESDGGALCRRLRDHGVTAPLLLLSGSAESRPCCAADAIVTKPLRLASLPAKIAELLNRRTEPAGLRIGSWRLDAGRRQLMDEAGKVVRLTDKEVAILCRLGRAGGAVVAREVLLTEVWGYSAAIATHTLETHIYRLRRKIEAGLLLSENGGYRLAIA